MFIFNFFLKYINHPKHYDLISRKKTLRTKIFSITRLQLLQDLDQFYRQNSLADTFFVSCPKSNFAI